MINVSYTHTWNTTRWVGVRDMKLDIYARYYK